MQTHEDRDFRPEKLSEFMGRLMNRAAETVRNHASEITAGKDGEPELARWKHPNGVEVVHRPDDEQGIQRISVGGGIQIVDVNYCVFRGDRIKCAFLLEQAAAALRAGPDKNKPFDD